MRTLDRPPADNLRPETIATLCLPRCRRFSPEIDNLVSECIEFRQRIEPDDAGLLAKPGPLLLCNPSEPVLPFGDRPMCEDFVRSIVESINPQSSPYGREIAE